MIDDPELPLVGVSPIDSQTVQWCVWAPKAKDVDLLLGAGADTSTFSMERDERGYHHATTPPVVSGQRYAYRLDGGPPLPDPCSRWQPEGVQKPSAYWSPENRSQPTSASWSGIDRNDLVFYELHVGTFTPEGTFDAVIPRIDALRELGITAIELMPVGQFPGKRSWGYDGVHPFAVQNSYGGPDGLCRLIDACHLRGMAIFLDVIYNHFGPEGNVFPQFGEYFTDKYKTDWGAALNFDGRGSDAVRAMVLDNVRQWIRDFGFDGLRIDASDQIYDRSPRHILAEIAEAVHLESAKLGRKAHVFAETDMNDAPRFLEVKEHGGHALDGQWNDDFHHAAHVTLTGETRGYYLDFEPGPSALAKVLNRGFVNDGSYSRFRGRRHGTSGREFPGDRYVAFTQNHDQVGNRMKSDRNASMLVPSATRLAAGILMLAPRLPLLFMGEEYGETAPFPYFCDVEDPDLIAAIRRGRKEEFSYFQWDAEVPDPLAAETRDSAILSWQWDEPIRSGLRRLYRDLLQIRRELAGLRDFCHYHASLLGENALELARGEGNDQLIVLYNLASTEQIVQKYTSGYPLLRSEITSYGGSEEPGSAWSGRLQPHEFLILPASGFAS